MPKLNGLRLLVVEDEFLIASSIAFALAENGATVVGPATDVETALRLAEAGEIDGALLDFKLGRVLSTPVAETLGKRRIPYLLMTGFGEAELPAALRPGPRIAKPFHEADLVKLCFATFAGATPAA